MKKMADNQFDLAIVDPPYGIGADKAQNNAALSRIKANGKSKAGRGWKLYKDSDWDSNTPSKDYFTELMRISKIYLYKNDLRITILVLTMGNLFTDGIMAEE